MILPFSIVKMVQIGSSNVVYFKNPLSPSQSAMRLGPGFDAQQCRTVTHIESMVAFGVQVRFHRTFGFAVFDEQTGRSDTAARVVVGGEQERRRRVGRDSLRIPSGPG